MKATASRTRAQTKVEANDAARSLLADACWAGLSFWRASRAPPPTEPRWLVICEARITERIAVPIEAPPWRMMFIAVEVRAIAAAGTACIAAVIVGIIGKR